MFPVFLVLALTGLLLAGLGVPLWRGKVPPNALYGFRTPKTRTNEEVWYEANRIGGRDLVLGGLGMVLLTAAVAPFVSESDPAPLLLLSPLLPLFLALGHSVWATSAWLGEKEAAEEVRSEPEPTSTPEASPPSRAAEAAKPRVPES